MSTFAVPPAEDDFVRRQRDLERAQQEQAAARSLEATSIGEGGLTVKAGGSIRIEDDGDLFVDGDAVFNGNLTVPAGTLNTAGAITATGTIQGGSLVSIGGATVAGTVNAGGFSTGGNISGANLTLAGGITAGGGISATGPLSTGGNLDVDGQIVVDGPIFTPHARANPVVTSYVAAYINSDGRLGATPSSRRFKQQITSWSFEWQALFAIELFTFKYNAAVEALGDLAPTEVGLMAEDLDALGLTWLVVYDEEGIPWAIAYERIALLLIPAVQDHERRIHKLEGALAELRDGQSQ